MTGSLQFIKPDTQIQSVRESEMGNATNRRPQNSKQAKSGNWSKRAKSDRMRGVEAPRNPKHRGKGWIEV